MPYSEAGIAHLGAAVELVYQQGWAEVNGILAPDLYRKATDEAVVSLDALFAVTDRYRHTSPVDTPVGWHVANGLAAELNARLPFVEYTHSMAYTSKGNKPTLALSAAGFELAEEDPDQSEIGIVANVCLVGGQGNHIVVAEKPIPFGDNSALLLAGSGFGERPRPPRTVPYSLSGRIGIWLSHHDPPLQPMNPRQNPFGLDDLPTRLMPPAEN